MDMKLFGIYGDNSIFAVIKAVTEVDAFNIFLRNNINDESLREYVDNMELQCSLLEVFYGDEIEHFHDFGINDYRNDLLQMSVQERNQYIRKHLEANVNDFWSDSPKFAEEYLREFYNSRKDGWNGKIELSDEFYIDTFKRLIRDNKWYESFSIIEIDLSNKNYQMIFERSLY